MTTRLRSTWAAGGGALLLVLALTGATLGADMAAEGTTTDEETAPLVAETAFTFVDEDGDGIEDGCDSDVQADAEAAAAAAAAVDTNADGTISVSEAAQSGRIGGANCNHGGYVSQVAQAQCDATEAPEATEDEDEDESTETPVDETAEAEDADEPCTDDEETTETEETAEVETPCVEVPAPPFDPAIFNGPGAFGAYVSTVANSDAVGGKNCNHGGAVSEAVKAAKAAAKAERDAARAAAKAERDAAKAERQAERAAAKAARDAAKQAKGKGNGH